MHLAGWLAGLRTELCTNRRTLTTITLERRHTRQDNPRLTRTDRQTYRQKDIMSFIGELISEVVGNHDRRDEAPEDPPYVQPPWVSRWDGEAGRWIFINEATGERSWERPVIEEAGE